MGGLGYLDGRFLATAAVAVRVFDLEWRCCTDCALRRGLTIGG